MLLMIDNYDSFTYNLVHYFEDLDCEVLVRRNDAITVADIDALAPSHIVISPGPGRPEDAGVSMPVIGAFSGKIPILGVCLGHQCIARVFGARVVHAARVMHGKTAKVGHSDAGVFHGLSNPLEVTRYHSLVVDPDTLPSSLRVTAWTEGTYRPGQTLEVMGLQNSSGTVQGVQFHPESVKTQQGHQLLQTFITGPANTGAAH
ncbi:anthranilate synthase component II [Gilvimarinus polysaccharolyticus]|uniref:anthranilate synthase component II n=1 Tax=Gilvimarinus polysaccharolyticus TaxID=863921 RepID=UPI0006735DEE|nr:aminodeoxychorismate/anthranilate synthase component II [Gilvimarinus polysaccharolyticus]